MTRRTLAIVLIFAILLNISLCNLRIMQVQRINDEKGAEDVPQDEDNQDDNLQNQQQEQNDTQEQLQDQIPQFAYQVDDNSVKTYLQELDINTSPDLYQDKISYDMFVQKYKGNSINSKLPQTVLGRSAILRFNINRIQQHNSKKQKSFILGLTQYADLTPQQFQERFFSNKTKASEEMTQKQIKELILNTTRIDWSCKAPPIFDSGSCHSAYASAVTEAIQITMRINLHDDYPLSVQEIISCGSRYHQQLKGCAGGSQKAVYEYILQRGVAPQILYQYVSQYGEQPQCNRSIIKAGSYMHRRVRLKSFGEVPAGDCAELVYRLQFRAVTVTVDSRFLSSYSRGLIDPRNHEVTPDHTVVLVGYSPENKAYKIKNSWGASWGMNGYAWVTQRLGVCNEAYYPVLFNEKPVLMTCH